MIKVIVHNRIYTDLIQIIDLIHFKHSNNKRSRRDYKTLSGSGTKTKGLDSKASRGVQSFSFGKIFE